MRSWRSLLHRQVADPNITDEVQVYVAVRQNRDHLIELWSVAMSRAHRLRARCSGPMAQLRFVGTHERQDNSTRKITRKNCFIILAFDSD